jgi:FG-GAP-like repeat
LQEPSAMRLSRLAPLLLAPLLAPLAAGQPPAGDKAPADAAGFARFRVQEIDHSLKVGYAVLLADVNGDGKPDIVVVDTDRVVWYENPTWQRRNVIDKQTKADNVSIAAADLDGDGQLEFALGADWGRGMRTKEASTLQWLKRGRTLDEPWTVHAIPCDEPTVHRIRFADLDGTGKLQLVVAPLMGRDSTNRGNWTDGRPVRLLAYLVPADPIKGPWVPTVINETLYVVHNFAPVPAEGRKGFDLLTASYDGVHLLAPSAGGAWAARRLGTGNQDTPTGSRGASEVKRGRLKSGRQYIATVEPWHGNQVVVYTPPAGPDGLWNRHVLDDHLRWGHAVWCADLDGDGDEELVIGVRDHPSRGDTFTETLGVRVYKCRDGKGEKWDRLLVDPDGVAVEDLAAADLDGDGRIDLVAVGRATSNVRIYWNLK